MKQLYVTTKVGGGYEQKQVLRPQPKTATGTEHEFSADLTHVLRSPVLVRAVRI